MLSLIYDMLVRIFKVAVVENLLLLRSMICIPVYREMNSERTWSKLQRLSLSTFLNHDEFMLRLRFSIELMFELTRVSSTISPMF